MAFACPQSLAGQSDGMYYYFCVCCPGGNPCSASDSRAHTVGGDCSSCIDPIALGPGAGGEIAEGEEPNCCHHVCGCAVDGLADYVTLDEPFKPKKNVVAKGTAWYRDGKRTRKVRWFIIQVSHARKPPTLLHIALELGPRTALPAEGCFEATIDHQHHRHHRIRLKGLDKTCFDVITKGEAKAPPKKKNKKAATKK